MGRTTNLAICYLACLLNSSEMVRLHSILWDLSQSRAHAFSVQGPIIPITILYTSNAVQIRMRYALLNVLYIISFLILGTILYPLSLRSGACVDEGFLFGLGIWMDGSTFVDSGVVCIHELLHGVERGNAIWVNQAQYRHGIINMAGL
jgi:hypothetical protein